MKALETVPTKFTIEARNPEKSVAVGEDDFVFLPGNGAPNVVTSEGEQRKATMSGYETWQEAGSKRIDQVAGDKVNQRLASYVKPDINPGIEKDLNSNVAKLQ